MPRRYLDEDIVFVLHRRSGSWIKDTVALPTVAVPHKPPFYCLKIEGFVGASKCTKFMALRTRESRFVRVIVECGALLPKNTAVNISFSRENVGNPP